MLFKDIVNPVKWMDYLKFLLRKLTGKFFAHLGYKTPEDMYWQSEVVVFRQLMCSDCAAAGKCVGIAQGETEACGCDFIGKSTDMSLECSLGNWKATPTKEVWEKQKKNFMHGLTFGFVKQ